ncbi:MAG: flagellar basal body P-ring formation protein FlgA [Planctomycetaceae bacterium]|nr:flagellar basal body P-ring formation protein FlgA [Planctomycetaceae bacterium]
MCRTQITSTECRRRSAVFCGCIYASLWLTPASPSAGEPAGATIQLVERVEVAGPIIHLADLIETEGVDERLSQRLREIDLAAESVEAGSQRIDRRLIELRLRLAGIDTETITLTGPQEVVIDANPVAPRPSPRRVNDAAAAVPAGTVMTATDEPPSSAERQLGFTDFDVEQAATDVLSTELHAGPEELRVTLLTPIAQRLPQHGAQKSARRLEIVPQGSRLTGRITAHCRLWEGTQLLASPSISLLIERRYDVLVTVVSTDRGEPVEPQALRQETRYLADPADEITPEQLAHYVWRTALGPGQIISMKHVTRGAAARAPVAIQARDAVRVVASQPGLQVVLRQAEALEPGRIGDSIRVRNRETGRIMTGQVTAAGVVEIAL